MKKTREKIIIHELVPFFTTRSFFWKSRLGKAIITGWWSGTLFIFHILGIIIPTDYYFLEGLKPPTRLYIPFSLPLVFSASSPAYPLWLPLVLNTALCRRCLSEVIDSRWVKHDRRTRPEAGPVWEAEMCWLGNTGNIVSVSNMLLFLLVLNVGNFREWSIIYNHYQ